MLELKIYNPTESESLQEVRWNYEELKKEIATRVEDYKIMVYTDDQIKQAKNDRAKLNKLKIALDDRRKDIKKLYSLPYEHFESQIKEVIALINEPINIIDSQIKNFEEAKKQEKLDEIKSYFSEANPFDFVNINNIFNQKWLNATASMPSIKKDIDSELLRIGNDIKLIEGQPEYVFEGIDMYKRTLDLHKSMSEMQRLKDIAERKAAAEMQRRAEEEARKAIREEECRTVEEKEQTKNEFEAVKKTQDYVQTADERVKEEEPERTWIGFEALINVTEAHMLAEFMKSNGIRYRKPQ